MEKIITIGDKDVRFKTNGRIAKLYMAQFKRDLLKDVMSISIKGINLKTATDEEKLEWMRDNLDFMMFYDIAWVFAKAGDNSIDPPEEWLEGFETFPLIMVLEPIMELLEVWIGTKKKPTIK